MAAQRSLLVANPVQPTTWHYVESFLIWVQEYLFWWYVQAPLFLLKMTQRLLIVADDSLSLTVILRNLFSPWHRDPSIAGWVVGIIVKILYTPIAGLITLVSGLVLILVLVLWLLLPPVCLIYILIGPLVA